MCIIIYKPANIPLPNNKTLQNCFNSNPDGCGLMYRDNNSNQIIIQKGFMSYNSLSLALTNLSQQIDITANDIILHFRYATQGTITPGNCHPFPITTKTKDLQELSITTNSAMVHNGIISFCSDYTYSKKSKKDNKNKDRQTLNLSDTQIFIRDYLSQIPNNSLFNPAILALIKESTNSKFIFMDVKHIEIVGNFIKDKGIYYSNDTYKTSRFKFEYDITELPEYTDKGILDYCLYCGKYTYITDQYNWVCEKCENILSELEVITK